MAAKPAGGATEVVIADLSYTPKVLKVPVGATVTWVNRGQAPHTVTADDGSFASDTLRNGQTLQVHLHQGRNLRLFAASSTAAPAASGMAGVIQVG